MTRACPSRCGWQTNIKLTAWISFTLHCMSPLLAQSGHGAMSESCPLLEVKRISLPGCIERLHFEGTLGPLPLAPRTLGCHPGRTSHIRWHEQTPSHV